MKISLAAIPVLFSLDTAESLAFSTDPTSRRNALKQAFLASTSTILVISNNPINPHCTIEACRPKARNCIRTTWTSPESMTKSEAIDAIRKVLNSYPRNGQNGVDCNGWTLVNDSLDGDEKNTGRTARLEYKSCVGPAALAINLGQPFIDDLKLEMQDSNASGVLVVEVKSSSRMGSTDLFVNKKRIEFLGSELRKLGWNVPDVKYGV